MTAPVRPAPPAAPTRETGSDWAAFLTCTAVGLLSLSGVAWVGNLLSAIG